MKQTPNRTPSFLAINIRFLRKKHGLSQEVFAEKIGLNRGNIASYENGTCEPSICNLKNLSHFFNISIGDITSINLSFPNAHGIAINKFTNRSICENELVQTHLANAKKMEQLIDSLHLTFHSTAENIDCLPKDMQFLLLNFDQMYKGSKRIIGDHKDLLEYLHKRIC